MPTSVEINGFCEPRFAPILDAFRANFDDGLEVGASLAVIYQGKPVVDLWAGHADLQRSRQWQPDTIVQLYSTAKIVTTMAFLMLVDRGLVALDATVASYWPEFGASGKDRVTVREALTHRAGVPGFDPPVRLSALYDWDAITAHIAAQPHWYGGRTELCYHGFTFGFVLGEIMRRVDGRLPSQFFREELAEPAGIDLQLRARSRTELERIADEIYLTRPAVLLVADPLANRASNSVAIAAGDIGSWEFRSAEVPAANALGNARAIARLCSIAAMGGVLDGHRYLSQAIIDEASSLQVEGVDPIEGPIRLGLCFGLHSEGFPAPTPTCFHWGGYGGSLAIVDQSTGVAIGYAMNNLIIQGQQSSDWLQDSPRFKRQWRAFGEVMSKL